LKAIFVVGTGRSGTHFTARLLNGFARAYDPLDGKENPQILKDVARAAIHHHLPSYATAAYYRRYLENAPVVFLDQHHPNLFFMGHWAAMFDGIVFLYPHRPTYQVVASMLRHDGVMRWYEYARKWPQRTFRRLPYPNRFLGVDSFVDLDALPAHLLCAHRVMAHERVYQQQVGPLRGALRSVDYEAMVADPAAALKSVFTPEEAECLGKFTLMERPRSASLSKYRDVLSDAQVAEIVELERQLGWIGSPRKAPFDLGR
jgi:hypothetical protein